MEDWAALTNHPVNYVDLSSDSNTSNNCPTMILFQHSRSSFVNSLLFALPNYNLAHYFRLLWRRLYPPSEPWLSRYRIITVSEAITAELEGFGRGMGGKVMGILWLQFGECAKTIGVIILALKSKLLNEGPRIIFLSKLASLKSPNLTPNITAFIQFLKKIQFINFSFLSCIFRLTWSIKFQVMIFLGH